MDMFQCLAEDMSTFRELATSPLLLIKSHLKEDSVPKAVSCKGTGIDSIQNACGSFIRSSILPQQQT
jgi:hypothetical protein